MRRPLFCRVLLLAALCLPAAAWSVAPIRPGGGKAGGLFGKVSPALAQALHHTLESKGFVAPGFQGLVPEHPALRPLASILADPEGFLTLGEPARQAELLRAIGLARTTVQQKAADLIVLAAKEDRASLTEAVDGLGEIELDYPMFLEESQMKLVAAVRGPAAEKLAALTLDKAEKTAAALNGDRTAEVPETGSLAPKDGRRDQARVLLARIRGGRGKTREYVDSLVSLAALAKKGPDEGLERLILTQLVAYLDKAEDGRKVPNRHDYLLLREAILDIARSSFFENSQLIAVRGLAADARSSWRPNGTDTLKKIGELALATRSRRVKREALQLLTKALNEPGARDDDEAQLVLGALATRLDAETPARPQTAGPWEARPSARAWIARTLPFSAGLALVLSGLLAAAGFALKNPLAAWGFLIPFLASAALLVLLRVADLRERRLLVARIGELLARPELSWEAKLRGPKGLRTLKDLSKAELETLEWELREERARPPLILDN